MVSVERNQELQRQAEQYLLGHSEEEELRLRRQAEELRQESARLFDRIGIGAGSRAIDLGCGPQGVLDLLSEARRLHWTSDRHREKPRLRCDGKMLCGRS